jgi:hypothetical protein
MEKFSDFLEGRCWPGHKPVPGKKPFSPGSCMKEEDIEEDWSQKYKSSINCSHPKGFSQKAHCAGKKKQNESFEMEHVCPDCGMCQTHGSVNEASAGAIAAATAIAKKKSGNYDKDGFRKTPYKNPDSPNRKSNAERRAELKEDLRDWFSKTSPKGDWKRINSKGEAIGPCAREPGEPKPKCMSQAQRASLSKKERASAVRRKRQQDPNAERQGAPINVKSKVNENMEQINEKNKPTNPELWSRAIAQAKSKFDVYPSAYANGWASKWYKSKGGSWKSVSEAAEVGDDPTTQEMPNGLEKRGSKTVIRRFKEISEIVMPQVKDDLSGLDKSSFVKKHGLSKSAAKQKLTSEAKEKTEYDYEGDMARGQLQSVINNAQRVHDMLEDNDNLPEWVQSKITLAEDYISTVANYMMSEIDEEVMQEEDAYDKDAKPSNKPHDKDAAAKRAKDAALAARKKMTQEEVQIDELSNDMLGRYKTAAGADASKADKAGDYDKGNKRFSGIMKATKKQFSNDLKKEEVMQEREDDEYHTPSKHHVQVQVSKGDGPKEHRKATVTAKEPSHAVSAAISHYKSQGYTVHDHKYLGEETIQEGRPSQRHPLEGHEYHKKSNDALIHIAKDAHAAAEAMKSHNTTAENKYRDQANDSATVRHFRKTSGMPDWYKKKYGHMKEDTKQDNSPPFDGPYKKAKGDVKDKSGAIHTAQSMAKDAAHRGMQMAMKKKGIKESKQASIVRDAVKSAKDKKKATSEDKFQADPELSNSITRNV